MRNKAKSTAIRAYRLLGILVVLMVIVGVILYTSSDLFTSRAAPTFDGFEPKTGDVARTDASASIVSIWVDMGASMSGFLPNEERSCIPSSYRMMLNDLMNIVKAYSPIAEVEFHRFDSNFSYVDTSVTEDARAAVRTEHGTDLGTVTNANQYPTVGPDAGKSSVALPSVLNALDLSVPSVIFTDLEADGLTITADDYKKPLARIFDAGRCISVVGMKSAYGGILYNYLNDGENYLYGAGDVKGKQMLLNYIGHNYPRPFYAIIVGTSKQCQSLRDKITGDYGTLCEESITSREAEIIKKDKHDEYAKDYVELETVDYWLNAPYDVLTAVDGTAVTVTGAEGLSASADSVWQAQGVPEYTATQNGDGKTQTAVLSLRILPDNVCYADTCLSDTFSVQTPVIKQVTRTQVRDASLSSGKKVLEGRGDRRTLLDLGNFSDEHQWFTAAVGKADETGVPLTLTILVSACDPGLYRVTLPLSCQHEMNIKAPDTAWAEGWSLARNKLEAAIDDKENPVAARTIGLTEVLDVFHRSEATLSGAAGQDVAEITIDIIVK